MPGLHGGIYRLDIHGFWHPASGNTLKYVLLDFICPYMFWILVCKQWDLVE